MANTNDSGYRLKLKYENIPLEFGSRVLVNNSNLTKEYAEKLLQQEGGERYFDVMPEPKKDEGSKAKGSDEATELTIESLTKAVNEAESNLNALPANAHHKKRKAAENALKQAKEKLEGFNKA